MWIILTITEAQTQMRLLCWLIHLFIGCKGLLSIITAPYGLASQCCPEIPGESGSNKKSHPERTLFDHRILCPVPTSRPAAPSMWHRNSRSRSNEAARMLAKSVAQVNTQIDRYECLCWEATNHVQFPEKLICQLAWWQKWIRFQLPEFSMIMCLA